MFNLAKLGHVGELGEFGVGDVLETESGNLLIVDARDFALNLLGSGRVSYVLVDVSTFEIAGCVEDDWELQNLWLTTYEIRGVRRGDSIFVK